MTSKNYIKFEHVRTCILRSSLALFDSFDPNAFFVFPSVCYCLVTSSLFRSCIQRPCVPLSFFKGENFVSVVLFVRKLQTVFPLNPTFSKGTSFFENFVGNNEPLTLSLHMVALPASVTLS